MGNGREQRKVLVIAEDPWARDTIRVLLGSMGCHWVMASSVQQGLATLDQEAPDAAILDAQCTTSSVATGFSGIEEICLSLRGRVIVLTGGSLDPEVASLIQRCLLPRVRRERLLQDLWSTLNSLLRPSSVFRRVIHAARLVFDSFFQPVPAGIRISQRPSRRFVYEAGSLMVDVSLEPQVDSRRISLVGQLVDSAKPERRFDTLPVALHGPKGPIAVASTNKFGEFHLDFNLEQSVTLEIETVTNQWISVALPRLEWIEKGAAGAA